VKVAFSPAHTARLTGCVAITGNWPSLTVTVNEQVELLPQASVAVAVTVVVPRANTDPDAGRVVMVTAPPQLSVAFTVKFTTALQEPIGELTVMLAGQVITGAV